MKTLKKIQNLVKRGESFSKYGAIAVKEQGDLVLLNYLPAATKTWNEFECLCRGLIINKKTGEIVARHSSL
jgi:hypothetical protein